MAVELLYQKVSREAISWSWGRAKAVHLSTQWRLRTDWLTCTSARPLVYLRAQPASSLPPETMTHEVNSPASSIGHCTLYILYYIRIKTRAVKARVLQWLDKRLARADRREKVPSFARGNRGLETRILSVMEVKSESHGLHVRSSTYTPSSIHRRRGKQWGMGREGGEQGHRGRRDGE